MKKIYLMFTLLVCFFIFSLEPKAEINQYYDYQVIYNYDSSSVFDTVDKNFFGANGYLEQVRNVMNDVGARYFMFFTKNDIYVLRFDLVSIVGVYLGFNYEPTNSLTYLTLSTRGNTYNYVKYNKLSNYSNITDFVLALGANEGFTNFSDRFYFTVSSSHKCSDSFIGGNYNYFTNCDNSKNYDYIIPYSMNRFGVNDVFTYTLGSASSTVSTIGYSYRPRLNGSTDFTTQTYYDRFGIFSKTQISSKNLNDVSALVPIEKISNFKVNYSWYCDQIARPTYVNAYGKVLNGTDYYWENIKYNNDKTIPYYAVDYIEPTKVGNVCSIGIQSNTNAYGNLEKYSHIYITVGFENDSTKNVRMHSYDSSDKSIKVIFNDVAQYQLIDEVEYLSDYVYFFSTKDDYYNKYFHYTLFPKNYIPYLEIGNYNYESKKNIYAYNYTDSWSVNSLYYPTMQRMSVDKFGSLNKTGIYFYSNPDYDLSNHLHNIAFAYDPTNIYVSVGKFNDLKTGFDINYIDKDGNIKNDYVIGEYDSDKDIGISSLFNSVIKGARTFVNCGIEILSLVNSFYLSLPASVQALVVLIFILGLLGIFIRMIM